MRSEGAAGMKGAERKIPAPLPRADRPYSDPGRQAFAPSTGGGRRVSIFGAEQAGDVIVNEINTIPGSMAFTCGRKKA